MKTSTFWARTCLSHICLLVATVFCCLYPHDLRAAGYVDKDSYLYPIMIDIRYKRYDEAMAKLEPYALKGDATALFWYGYMKQENFGRDRYGAYQWYEESIKGGNPYSMFKLSGAYSTQDACEINGWDCSEEYLDAAIQNWKALAEKGDAKAEYYHWYYDRSFFQQVYEERLTDKYEHAMMQAAKNGYYRPLVESIGIARRAKQDYREYWGDEMYQALLDNIDNDPKIAMHFIINPHAGMTEGQRRELYFESVRKGWGGEYYYRFFTDGLISGEEAYVLKKAWHWGTGKEFNEERSRNIFDIPPKDSPELEKKAEELYNSMEHVINFDEMDFMFMFEPDV